MIRTSFGQMQSEAAKAIYKRSAAQAQALAAAGKIAPAAVEETFARLVVEACEREGITVSRRILARATAASVAPATPSLSSTVGAVARQGTGTVAREVFVNTLRAGGAITAALGVAETMVDAYRAHSGAIDGREFKVRAIENVAGGAGGLAGAAATSAAFGALGSVVPVFGTAAGLFIGGVVGGLGGSTGLRSLARRIFGR
jgi:hypothetical protein